MHIRVGLENTIDKGSVAWVLEHPGVTARGRDGSEALMRVPQALVDYQGWLAKHTQESWLADLGDFDVSMVELLGHDAVENAPRNWFTDDQRPLEPRELQQGLQVLAWQRADLLEMAGSFTPSELARTFEGEDLNLQAVLEGITRAEQQLLKAAGLTGEVDQSADVFTQLKLVRNRLTKSLIDWPEEETMRESEGERWSPRKLLRCAVREERERMQDLVRLMNYF